MSVQLGTACPHSRVTLRFHRASFPNPSPRCFISGKSFLHTQLETRNSEPLQTTDFQRGHIFPAQENVRTRDRQHTPVSTLPNCPAGSKPIISAVQLFLAGKLTQTERLRIQLQITMLAKREHSPKQRVSSCELPVQLKHSAQQNHSQRGLAEGRAGGGLWEVRKAAEEENTKPTES